MKKMISSFGSAVLSREQMKGIKGGGAECDGCTESECKGSCSNGGYVCGWVNKSCACTAIAIGIE